MTGSGIGTGREGTDVAGGWTTGVLVGVAVEPGGGVLVGGTGVFVGPGVLVGLGGGVSVGKAAGVLSWAKAA